MISWIKEKLSNINSILDVGILVGLISSLFIVLIYCFKFTYLHIIDIPFNIAVKIIDMETKDFVLAFFFCLAVIVLALVSYFSLYKKKWVKRILNTILFIVMEGAVFYILKWSLWKTIMGIIALTPLYIGLAYVIFLLIDRPTKIIDTIFKKESEITKFLVTLIEILLPFLCVVCITCYLANVCVMIPSKKVLCDGKVIIYSSNDNYFVADYTIESNNSFSYMIINKTSFQLIEKDGVSLATTEDLIFYK